MPSVWRTRPQWQPRPALPSVWRTRPQWQRVADEAAERDPSAYEGAAEEETRIAPDGHAYTKLEFETFFGGLVEWNNANMQTSKKRKRKNKDRVAPSPPASRGMMYEDLHLARIMAGQDPGHGADDEPEDDVDMDGGGGLRHCQFIDHEAADTRMPRPIRVTIGKPGKGSKKGRLIAKRVGAAAKKADAADERQAKAAAKKAEKAAKAAAKEAETAAKAAAKEAETAAKAAKGAKQAAAKAAAKEAETAAKAAKGAKQAPAKVASKNTEEKAASASDEAKIICADCFETFAAEEMVTHGSFFVCKSQEECQSRVCSRGRGIKRTCRRT